MKSEKWTVPNGVAKLPIQIAVQSSFYRGNSLYL